MIKNIFRAMGTTIKECGTIAKEEFNKEWKDYKNSESYKNNKAQLIDNLGKAKANMKEFKGAWGEFKEDVNKSAEEYARRNEMLKQQMKEIEDKRRLNKNNTLIVNGRVQTVNVKDKVEPTDSKSWDI